MNKVERQYPSFPSSSLGSIPIYFLTSSRRDVTVAVVMSRHPSFGLKFGGCFYVVGLCSSRAYGCIIVC